MTPELKEKWASALESGKYKQGLGTLRDDDTYCCLGVLCDIQGCEWKREQDELAAYIDGILVGIFTLNNNFLSKIGMSTEAQSNLTHVNDVGVPFPSIAKLVRQLPEDPACPLPWEIKLVSEIIENLK